MTVGLMLSGLYGNTASTAAVSMLALAQDKALKSQIGSFTLRYPWTALDLPEASNIEIGGWDVRSFSNLLAAARANRIVPENILNILEDGQLPVAKPGITASSDFRFWNELNPSSATFADLCSDIDTFRNSTSSHRIVVINCISPEVQFPGEVLSASAATLLNWAATESRSLPSSLMYALAAVRSGAAYVEFTPAQTLDCVGLIEAAEAARVPVAGKDASTGQTLLKMHLLDLFAERGFRIRSWFSTNLIGNSDGAALQEPARAVVKLVDKSRSLPNAEDPDAEHVVSIEYVKSKGDNKESWDAVELTGWFGYPMQLRLNWLGQDSFLATPLIFDLTRLIANDRCWQHGGLVQELGYFFKAPSGVEDAGLSQLRSSLISFFDLDAPGSDLT